MSYRKGAMKFYDLFGEKEDASFYISLAHKHGKKALELGVGTARLAIQLARSGFDVWGIDNSIHMLKAAENKITNLPEEVRRCIHLQYADVRNFNLNEKFDLIYFPSFSFDHLLSRNDQCSALKSIRKHLSSGGAYVFDLANISINQEKNGWFIQNKQLDDSQTVMRTGFRKVKLLHNIISINLWYELYEDGLLLERYHEAGDVYIHSVESIRKLLKDNGFEITALYGSHDLKPFMDSSDMMVIVSGMI